MARKLWATVMISHSNQPNAKDRIYKDPHYLGEVIHHLLWMKLEGESNQFLDYSDMMQVVIHKRRRNLPDQTVYQIGAPREVWDRASESLLDLEEQFNNM